MLLNIGSVALWYGLFVIFAKVRSSYIYTHLRSTD